MKEFSLKEIKGRYSINTYKLLDASNMTRVKAGPKQGFKEKKTKIPVNTWEGVAAASDKKDHKKFEKHSCGCTLRYHFVSGTWTPAFTYSSFVHKQFEP